jgi:soluble lytic murein transglycosylase
VGVRGIGPSVALAVALLVATPAGADERAGRALGEAWRALEDGDPARAAALAKKIDRARLANPDYLTYVSAQASLVGGQPRVAIAGFRALAKDAGSRFRGRAAWLAVDARWAAGEHKAAALAYAALLRGDGDDGDRALARFRIAEAAAEAGDGQRAREGFRALRLAHPRHPLEPVAAERLRAIGGEAAAALAPADRLERAALLTAAKKWDDALVELGQIPDDVPTATRRERDRQTAMTLFKMRRQYERAGRILLGLYKDVGDRAAEALFHGARALSRADHDAEAIRWYQRVVAEYPGSRWAAEAQFLSGWLEFNLGRYREALPGLRETVRRFGKTEYAVDARWYLGLAHYLLGEPALALGYFDELAKRGDRLEGGKGQYWKARAMSALDREADARAELRRLVGRFPWSWYALLARARLLAAGEAIEPFGDAPRAGDDAPAIDAAPAAALRKDPLLVAADELVAAGLGPEAAVELRRGEKGFLARHRGARPAALATLLDAYRRAGDYNRPWTLAVSWAGRALDAPPTGRGKVWWEHGFPQAYRELVERHRPLGGSPEYYLYAIMRKESGYDPNVHSYADAMGLLQMIPATTKRVCAALGIPFTEDLLFDPESNIRTGSWYIGKLLAKFKGQIPFGAGSFNSGPRPVMAWLDRWGDRPVDELVELVPYEQTREYMKKVTEIFARYRYLYLGEVYVQPLIVDRAYVKDALTY